MVTVKVRAQTTAEPLPRIPVVVVLDADHSTTRPVLTDPLGEARFAVPPGTGKILVDGVEHYHGLLKGQIIVDLATAALATDLTATPLSAVSGDSIAYPSMQTKVLLVDGNEVLVDSEGYLVYPRDWSEAFVRAEAKAEGLALDSEHWEVIRFLRSYYSRKGVQAAVRDMVKHFRQAWGPQKGTSSYLHQLFPKGGPQKQGNRLAGILRTKGEH
ncbi:MAG: TusE/DsrC/DsvC family sulfur relay protein [Gammaproteobacteria bacterium]